MKKLAVYSAAILGVVTLVATGASAGSVAVRNPQRIVSIGGMYGVDGPFVGPSHPIHQLPGDELPWVVGSARGQLKDDGHLVVDVQGIVFSNDPSVPPELQGINDETQFRAALGCQTEDAQGNIVDTIVFTDGFAASRTGDCHIDAMINLPKPCVGPVLFIVAGSEDKWFAVSGGEERDGG